MLIIVKSTDNTINIFRPFVIGIMVSEERDGWEQEKEITGCLEPDSGKDEVSNH